MQSWNRRSLLAVGGALLAAPYIVRKAAAQPRAVVDMLAGDPRFNTMVELIGRAGLTEMLRGPGPYTLFAPTEEAFAAAPSGMIDDLANQGTGGGGGGNLSGASPDPIRLRAFLQYHIIPGQALTLAQLAGGERTLRTANGANLVVRANAGQPVTIVNPAPGQQIAGFGAAGFNAMPPAPVVQTDIPASNGVIHAIGRVLFP